MGPASLSPAQGCPPVPGAGWPVSVMGCCREKTMTWAKPVPSLLPAMGENWKVRGKVSKPGWVA